MKVGIACGGTGGHILPGRLVGEVLRERGHEVTLWLAGRGVEAAMVATWQGGVESVVSAGFSGGNLRGNLRACWLLVAAVLKCRARMRSGRPDVLLAMGSYASVGPVLAAWSLGVPVVLHEANAVPGRAIGVLARFAKATAITFEPARRYLSCRRVVLTGFPLRPVVRAGFESLEPGGSIFTLLVMGGSQGARRLNDLGLDAVRLLAGRGVCLQVVHLSGRADEGRVRAAYAEMGVRAWVFGFLGEMHRAYTVADYAVSRAGAASCCELAAWGVPSLLVPLPSARRGHQLANARILSDCGGADLCEERDLTAEGLADRMQRVMGDRARLASMRSALAGVAVPDAASRIAGLLDEVVKAAAAP